MNQLSTRRPVTTLRRIALVLLALVLILAVAACDDDGDEDEVAADPTPTEDAGEFAPERVFQVQVSDENTVDSVAYHPDGEMVAAGTFLEALLMDVQDGGTMNVIEYNHSIANLEFSPDGTLIGAAQGLHGVQINDVDDGSIIAELHGGYDNRLAFAPDGETIATANRDGVLWFWNVETGDQLQEFVPPEEEYALSIAYSPDGDLVALGNWNGDVFLFNAEDGELIRTFENPDDYGYAYNLSFSPDGEHLAIAGAQVEFDDVLRVWDVGDGDEVGTVIVDSETRAVAYSPDSVQLAFGHGEGITIVDPDDLSVLFELEIDADPDATAWITDVDYSPDGRFLVFSRWDGYVELWRVQE